MSKFDKDQFGFEEKKDKKKNKEHKNKCDYDILTLQDIRAEREKLERKWNEVKIPCSHTNSNGKLKVDFISNNRVRCKKCGEEFSFDVVSKKDYERAIETIGNMVNQIKAMSDNPEKEKSIMVQLGKLLYNLNEMPTLYERVVNKYGKNDKKKKKHNRNDDFGSFGINSVEFIPSNGKRNKY